MAGSCDPVTSRARSASPRGTVSRTATSSSASIPSLRAGTRRYAFDRTTDIWTPAPRDCGMATQRSPMRPTARRTNSSAPTSFVSGEASTAPTSSGRGTGRPK